MIYRISVDCFALSPELAEVFKAVRDDRSMGRSRVNVIAGGLPAAVAHYDGQPTPQVVIVEEEDDDDTMLARLEALAEVCEPGTKVVVIGTLNDIGLYRTLVGRGISEYLVRPVTARQLLDTVAGLFSDPGAAPRGKVVAVWGARGGVGASTIAQNLAWCLADGLAEDVVYIDLDLAFGTSVLAFNLDTKQTVADALANPDRLDQVLMDRFLVEYGDHLQVLPSPGDPRAAARIEVEAVDRLLDLASRMGAMVVVDVPHLWADWVEHLLTNADELVVVATPDLFCLRDTKTMVDLMTQRRGVSVPIRVVVNRQEASRRTQLLPKDFEETLKLAPALVVPSDPALFGQAANNGQMLAEAVKTAKPVELLRAFALSLAGRSAAQRKKPATAAKGLLAWLKS